MKKLKSSVKPHLSYLELKEKRKRIDKEDGLFYNPGAIKILFFGALALTGMYFAGFGEEEETPLYRRIYNTQADCENDWGAGSATKIGSDSTSHPYFYGPRYYLGSDGSYITENGRVVRPQFMHGMNSGIRNAGFGRFGSRFSLGS
ncbi:MAG: hypothetical protein J0L62_10255 [Bacteroidetes bacterium]|nr:hypothetical protein [Bacteroidota bacterium]